MPRELTEFKRAEPLGQALDCGCGAAFDPQRTLKGSLRRMTFSLQRGTRRAIDGSEQRGVTMKEIKFENVFSVISNTYFRVNPEIKSFSILEGEEAQMLNIKYHVEKGNTIYKILTEDGDDFYIIAESCIFRKYTVKYYG